MFLHQTRGIYLRTFPDGLLAAEPFWLSDVEQFAGTVPGVPRPSRLGDNYCCRQALYNERLFRIHLLLACCSARHALAPALLILGAQNIMSAFSIAAPEAVLSTAIRCQEFWNDVITDVVL
jgi:hypothetical protein